MNVPSSVLLESEKYFAAGLAAGCPFDQMDLFLRARLVHQPQQLAASAAARLCDQPDGPTAVGFGGARGGGKSHWLLAQLGADDCQRLPGLKCLLLRKVGKSNLEQLSDLRQRLFTRLPHKFAAARGLLTFANGSRIIAGHFQCEKDIDAYLGLEYDVIGIEEATTLSARKYHDIVTCCRSSKPGWRPRVYATTNPGGVGHVWFRTQYVIPFQLRQEKDTRFIPATIRDNSFTNPEYRSTLERLTGWQKRAWMDGDWDIAAGQFFTTFRREFHIVDDFQDGRAVEWAAGFDYGFNHYTVALLGAYDADGNLFIVDEHAARGWVPERHAEAIKAMCQRHGVTLNPRPRYSAPLSRFVAGQDLFARQSNGFSIARQYADQGINLRAAHPDRVNGWAAILRGFGDPAAGIKPTLFIHRRCTRLIETLPCLQHDPNRPEDVLKVDSDEDGIGGDDAADALRYLVANRAPRTTVVKLRGF
ncbi:MAG: phage terminase large subunit [Verrucomicrobiota bacterium]